MSQETQEPIGEKLARLLKLVSPQESPTIATVVRVNEEKGSCTCTTSNQEEHTNVRLMGHFDSNLVIVPKIKSKIIINFLDNMRTRGYVSLYSEIDKIILKNDSEIEITNRDLNIKLSSDKVKIKGKVEVEGDILVSGEVTAKSETMPVHLSTHKHAGPAGPPLPES